MPNTKKSYHTQTISITLYPKTIEKVTELAHIFKCSRSRLIEEFVMNGIEDYENKCSMFDEEFLKRGDCNDN